MRSLKTGRFEKTHGHCLENKNTTTYRVYHGMLSRCYNEKLNNYHRYGGRGVRVCGRWLESFENFLSDMGERPEGKSLDRIDNNGNYELSNCRWSTPYEQQQNQRQTIRLTVYGKTATISEWVKISGTKRCTIRERHRTGWPDKQCVFGKYA